MVRVAATLAVVGVVAFVIFRSVIGMAFGLLGIAFKLGILLAIGYLVLSLFSPESARKVREQVRGKSNSETM